MRPPRKRRARGPKPRTTKVALQGSVYPRTFSHIGISVPDLERAVSFYTEVLGWYVIGVLLRGYPRLQPGEETKLLRSRAGKAGSPPGRTGVHRPPANRRLSH
ncbi:VOC family protein [Streptomyces sp. WMMC905]|uniref:VOC family protein n=1 Tax=Streptomyces sp. WMMC905 TaxID=3404123 RepID=UPI003B93707B